MALLSILSMYNYDNNIFEGFSVPEGIDRDIAINTILLQNAEFEILYPDFDIMRNAIGWWSESRRYTWQHMYNTTTVEYNPIENYDRNEEYTSNVQQSSTSEEKRPAYDATNPVKVGENSASGTGNTVNTGRVHGNIGVTTTQQMIESERNVAEFSIYDYIADDFKHRFCIMLY